MDFTSHYIYYTNLICDSGQILVEFICHVLHEALKSDAMQPPTPSIDNNVRSIEFSDSSYSFVDLLATKSMIILSVIPDAAGKIEVFFENMQ